MPSLYIFRVNKPTIYESENKVIRKPRVNLARKAANDFIS